MRSSRPTSAATAAAVAAAPDGPVAAAPDGPVLGVPAAALGGLDVPAAAVLIRVPDTAVVLPAVAVLQSIVSTERKSKSVPEMLSKVSSHFAKFAPVYAVQQKVVGLPTDIVALLPEHITKELFEFFSFYLESTAGLSYNSTKNYIGAMKTHLKKKYRELRVMLDEEVMLILLLPVY
jgi:hypothetical protein